MIVTSCLIVFSCVHSASSITERGQESGERAQRVWSEERHGGTHRGGQSEWTPTQPKVSTEFIGGKTHVIVNKTVCIKITHIREDVKIHNCWLQPKCCIDQLCIL